MTSVAPLCVSTALFCVFAASVATPSSAEELDARLARVRPSHPRLFFAEKETAGMKAKIQGDPLLSDTLDYLIAVADGMLSLEPVKREKVGKRLLGVSRTCLRRVSYLAFAYRMTGKEAYLRRAEGEMLAASGFEDWNPSHFLDVAEMTAALGVGYDWLYNDLDPEARETIRGAIVEKGLRTSLKGGGWVLTTNNWNQVCHGGLTVGALAVLEDEQELARQIIARAIENVPRAMREYAPDGVYPEGPSYWGYGTTYNVILISALESVLGSDFGLTAAEGFTESADFYVRATGPTGLYFNFSDCGTRGSASSAMHWFAARSDDPSLLRREKGELAALTAKTPSAKGSSNRSLAFLLIWSRPLSDATPPEQLNWKGDGRTPVVLLRSGWDDDATYVGFKGGSPSTNHAHMDVGSFVVDMEGVRWALDLGGQGYHGLESKGIDLWNKRQESERWTVFRLNNLSHNTLVVDGELQRVAGNAPFIGFSGDEDAPHAVTDMTSAYDGQLAGAKRGIRLTDKAVLIQDEVKTLERGSSVRWGMVTRAQVEIVGRLTAKLTQDGKTVWLRVLAPEDAKLAVWDIAKPPRDYDGENPNTRMVGFEIDIPASTAARFGVLIEPSGEPAGLATLEALEDW
ncbi:MAG: alginate lyase family protein [bacterium]|nr:alginate lyase family protein [bacterium]